jgi:FkbM family methyltransferase
MVTGASEGVAARPEGMDLPFGHFAPTVSQRALIALVRNSFLNRGDFRRYFAHLLNLVRASPIDTQFRGGRFRLHYQDNLAECGILLSPRYNADELEFLIEGTPPGGIFVDLGANVGLYAIPLAVRVGPAGKIIAIDPGAEALRRLRFNIAASELANVIVYPCAVGDGEYRADLFLPREDIALSRVVRAEGGAVAVRPLLDLLAEAGVTRIDTMKVDVEGFEDKAVPPFFRNAGRDLWPRRICLEPSTFYGRIAIHSFLEGLGYLEVSANRKNSLFKRRE